MKKLKTFSLALALIACSVLFIACGNNESGMIDQETLTVNAVAGKKFGDAAFQLATTGGSGEGEVTFALVSGPATVTPGGLVTVTGAGSIVVKATKAADSKYRSAVSVNLTIIVGKAEQAMLEIIDVLGRKVGDAFQLATTGGSGTGVVTYEKISGTANVSNAGFVSSITSAGDIVVKATKAADNNFNQTASNELTITVGKANQAAFSIENPGAKTMLSQDFELVAVGGSSGEAVTFTRVSGTAATVSSAGFVSIVEAGSIAVTATMAGNSNYYEITSAELTITITKVNQTALVITNPGDKTVVDPAFQLVTTGGSGTGAVTYERVSGGATATVSLTGLVTITETENMISGGTVYVKATKAGDDIYNEATHTLGISIADFEIEEVDYNPANNIRLIRTRFQMERFRTLVNVQSASRSWNAKLMNDIDLQGSAGNPWIPMDVYGHATSGGVFDGNGYKISGLYMDGDDVSDASSGNAFIRSLYGSVKNLTIVGDITADYKGAGFVIYNRGSIRYCIFEGTVSSAGDAAGISVFNPSMGSVWCCINRGNISADNRAGGIAVEFAASTFGQEMFFCINLGSVTAGLEAGAVAVAADSAGDTTITGGAVQNCYYLDTTCAIGIYDLGAGQSHPQGIKQPTSKTITDFQNGSVTTEINGLTFAKTGKNFFIQGADNLPTLDWVITLA